MQNSSAPQLRSTSRQASASRVNMQLSSKTLNGLDCIQMPTGRQLTFVLNRRAKRYQFEVLDKYRYTPIFIFRKLVPSKTIS